MRSYQPSSDRRRAISLTLTILAHLLIAFLLWRLARCSTQTKEPGRSLTVNMLPVGDAEIDRDESEKAPARAPPRRAAAPRPSRPPRHKTRAPDASVPPPVDTPFPAIWCSTRMISPPPTSARCRRANRRQRRQATRRGGRRGRRRCRGFERRGGTGPGGQRLYNAEWYVEPAQSQLSPYLPPNVPRVPGRNRMPHRCPIAVEDCVQLGDSQPGSGLARAIRERRGSSRSAAADQRHAAGRRLGAHPDQLHQVIGSGLHAESLHKGAALSSFDQLQRTICPSAPHPSAPPRLRGTEFLSVFALRVM